MKNNKLYGGRYWVEIDNKPKYNVLTNDIIAESKKGPKFKIISYNVLAQSYCVGYRFPYCEPYNLVWRHRRENFMK